MFSDNCNLSARERADKFFAVPKKRLYRRRKSMILCPIKDENMSTINKRDYRRFDMMICGSSPVGVMYPAAYLHALREQEENAIKDVRCVFHLMLSRSEALLDEAMYFIDVAQRYSLPSKRYLHDDFMKKIKSNCRYSTTDTTMMDEMRTMMDELSTVVHLNSLHMLHMQLILGIITIES